MQWNLISLSTRQTAVTTVLSCVERGEGKEEAQNTVPSCRGQGMAWEEEDKPIVTGGCHRCVRSCRKGGGSFVMRTTRQSTGH